MNKITYFREKNEYLILRNPCNEDILCEVRINGYLWDIVYLVASREKKILLPILSEKVIITVSEILADIDLTNSKNCTHRNRKFFEDMINRNK
ncbi:hypothetical protein [Ligilactobacillus animalis]|jgi:hypothetical protein|uniref:hypothetical protein n=1 Tax=Ligilactobacillus animalis TaxID=1605 RepID=UPI002594BB58|nr:hypothetical protein [Ligilactobacillus animalis]